MPDNNNGSSFFRRLKASPGEQDLNGKTRNEIEFTPFQAKWAQKMMMEVNKLPYSNTKNIGLYSFNRSELEWFYKEIRLLIDTILDTLECPHCEDTIKKAVMPGCGCDNPLACCAECWIGAGSLCLNCKRQCTSVPFEPVDEIIRQCHLFLKEKAFNKNYVKCTAKEMKRINESYNEFLKHCEVELMCNYCFESLEKAMTVQFPSPNPTRSQICSACYESYMETYTECTNPLLFPTFDRLNNAFSKLFTTVLDYCGQNKTQVYKDPYADLKKPSFFKRVVRRRLLKQKIISTIKKVTVFAVFLYFVAYFIQ